MIEVRNFDTVKSFIRNELGCTCPEDVFSDIRLTENVLLPQTAEKVRRLLVGQRLLIYIARVESATMVRDILPPLTQLGRRERDQGGYNRVRIVLAAPDVSQVQIAAELLFAGLLENDEAMHLHVVPDTVVHHVR